MKKANSKDFSGYFTYYMDLVDGEDVIDEHQSLLDSMEKFYGQFSSKPDFQYAEGKWTPKDLIQHLMDAERAFCYRALSFARGDKSEQPGYDENEWTRDSYANERDYSELLEEFVILRKSTILLFKGLSDEVLDNKGVASGLEFSVRAIATLNAGHEIHHRKVLKARYL